MAAAASKARKKSYKATNWREYNDPLVRRGRAARLGARQRGSKGQPAVRLQRLGDRDAARAPRAVSTCSTGRPRAQAGRW